MQLFSAPPRYLALLLAVLTASCVSTTTPKPVELGGEARELPFRVAVIPVAEAEFAIEDEEQEGGLLDLQQVDAESGINVLTKHLQDSLQANVFTDVVLLDPPAAGPASDAHWVHAARRAGADLLLDVDEVRYRQEPESSGLWSSYALYLFGPVELLFADRTYDAKDCVMEVSLYDVNLMRDLPDAGAAQRVAQDADEGGAASAELADSLWSMNRGALLREFRIRPEEIDLRYGDRVKGGLGVWSVLKAVIVPSALLSTNSDHLGHEISDRTALGLATKLSERIVEGDEVYINTPSPRVARFHMAAEPTVEWRNGELYLEVPVNRYFRDRISDGRLVVDGTPYMLEFEEGLGGAQVRAQPASNGVVTGLGFTDRQAADEQGCIRETLKVLFDPIGAQPVEASFSTAGPKWTGQAAPEWVQIILEDNARGAERQVRSWTVRPKIVR